jgi:glycosyltransferase involved in cell wall biosynthesis
VCRDAVTGVVPESCWRLLANGLDLERFCPDDAAGKQFREEHGLGSGLLIGAASWFRPGKQLEHLFEAASAISRNATLVLAGGVAPGEEQYAERLRAHGEKLLGGRLRYLGCLDDLHGFYNALDLYVNTSKEETCSISIIEALACGLPVVGYPSVSVDEQVLPDGGEIVAQDEIGQLTNAVDRWGRDECLRTSARLHARRQAVERFDIRKLSDQLWDEYQAMLDERAGGRRKAALAAC